MDTVPNVLYIRMGVGGISIDFFMHYTKTINSINVDRMKSENVLHVHHHRGSVGKGLILSTGR